MFKIILLFSSLIAISHDRVASGSTPQEARGKLDAARSRFIKALTGPEGKTKAGRSKLVKNVLSPATGEMNKAIQGRAAEVNKDVMKGLSSEEDKKGSKEKASGPSGEKEKDKDKDKKDKPAKKQEIVLDGSKIPKEIEFKKQVGKLPASTPASADPTSKERPQLKPSHSGEGVTEIEFK